VHFWLVGCVTFGRVKYGSFRANVVAYPRCGQCEPKLQDTGMETRGGAATSPSR
jgi:hypothetical protein